MDSSSSSSSSAMVEVGALTIADRALEIVIAGAPGDRLRSGRQWELEQQIEYNNGIDGETQLARPSVRKTMQCSQQERLLQAGGEAEV